MYIDQNQRDDDDDELAIKFNSFRDVFQLPRYIILFLKNV